MYVCCVYVGGLYVWSMPACDVCYMLYVSCSVYCVLMWYACSVGDVCMLCMYVVYTMWHSCGACVCMCVCACMHM